MEFNSLIAAAIGFAPPIALMLWTLQGYTYPKVERPYFSDPKLFGMFAVGIVVGIVMYALSSIFSFEYLIVGFALEEAVKLLIINMPRFQLRADTPFYGFGLGAGMASSLAFGSVNFALINVGLDLVAIVPMIATSVLIALLNISTATTIGMGVARGRPWPFFGQALVIHLATVLLLYPLSQGGWLGYALFVVALVFIASYYWYLFRKLLPAYVREALRHLAKKKVKKGRRPAE
ncbi:hypothetical protein [Methanomassiliicoccus luminyensis]|jgi:hypothetical protein|uniref:hypothetical protein n=1 Tax=Methanomassiliicoccus luminyensis TaxID=1080712 RepID=UPI000364519A|nr:hypothetical protein [Methanomassiliicoccus luminyensis]